MVSISLGKDFHVDPYFMMSEASIAEHHKDKKKAIAIVTVKLTARKILLTSTNVFKFSTQSF